MAVWAIHLYTSNEGFTWDSKTQLTNQTGVGLNQAMKIQNTYYLAKT